MHIGKVEGMAYLGSRFFAAGQAGDAVYEVSGSKLRKVIQLTPVPGQDGVDGIGVQAGLLVVPDSPDGVVDWVDPDSGRIVKRVGGFTRPTGVWNALDGSLLVADEFGNAVVSLAQDGSREYLVRNLPIVDDVAQDAGGDVFVVTPAAADGRLVQVLPGGGTHVLLEHLAAPQGLAVDGAGNLYFSEEDAGKVDLLKRSAACPPSP